MMKTLYLTITNECNLRCPHCYKEDYGKSLLNKEKVEKYLKDHTDISCINLYGGEPLLQKYNDRVLDIIDIIPKEILITCVSNLCFEELSEKQLKIINKLDNLITSWTKNRFNDKQLDIWLNNLDKLSKIIDIDLIVTLTKDVIDMKPNDVLNFLEKLPVKKIKFEPYIGNITDVSRPLNKDVDIWLTEYYNLTNKKEKYTLFENIKESLETNVPSGIFNRKCIEHIITMQPNGDMINCPNRCKIDTKELLKQLKYNNNCYNCKYFRICNGSCSLLLSDESGCCGYPNLFGLMT